MKKLNRLLAVTGVTLALAFSGAKALAQGGGGGGGIGGFDPAQMLQMMVDNMRDTLSVTSDRGVEDHFAQTPESGSITNAGAHLRDDHDV